jgi:short subunit dehydrogenase-like uncharacterized protein
MTRRYLLYGANGFSGRILARVLAKRWAAVPDRVLVLAGRDGKELQELADELGVEMQIVALDDHDRLDAVLDTVHAVINAAGPFAFTALPLVKAALRMRRHYIDINGEADVYKQLDDYQYLAEQRGIVLCSGAGHSAATSDLMLALALGDLERERYHEVGTVRIAFSHVKYVSRGSAQTAWRSIRERTMVATRQSSSRGGASLMLDHEPTGRIERVFDFGDVDVHKHDDDRRVPRRIAMAANLLDLLTARLTLNSAKVSAQRVEAFIEMPEGARAFVQLGTLSAPLQALPLWRRLVREQVDRLPEGPSEKERLDDGHTVLLQIDDGAGRMLVDWRIQTPDPYDFTAECVALVVEGLEGAAPGWRTPSELVDAADLYARQPESLLPGCTFEKRRSP